MNDKRPPVGLGVIVEKDGKILIGKRLSSHGSGTYMLPGGHLEFGETFEECAAREVMEESRIIIKNITFACVHNDIAYDKHYVTIGMHAEWESGDPKEEVGVSEEWQWMDPRNLPEPMFYHSKRNIDAWLLGEVYQP